MPTTYAAVGDPYDIETDTEPLAESCGQDNGHWVCLTHKTGFQHNLARDSHTEEPGDHILAWHCYEHGPEAA